jgi:hypothetical protein
MGAAVLITLGVLFLLDELTKLSFDQSFPALLIVIGVILYLGRSASTEGHVQPFQMGSSAPPPPPATASDQHGPEVSR